jgi:hypothetical protein
MAAHIGWAGCEDRRERTRPGLDAINRRYEDEVDPERKLSQRERQKRAENAKKAHMARISLLGIQARREKRAKKPDRNGRASAPKPTLADDSGDTGSRVRSS